MECDNCKYPFSEAMYVTDPSVPCITELVQQAYDSGYTDGWGHYNGKKLEVTELFELESV
jgi:hypothetical protein